jgi:hypothetical protein
LCAYLPNYSIGNRGIFGHENVPIDFLASLEHTSFRVLPQHLSKNHYGGI